MGYIKIGYIEIECPVPVPMRLMGVEPCRFLTWVTWGQPISDNSQS